MCLAIPGLILDMRGEDPLTRTGRVDFGGVVREVNLAFVPEAEPGAYVLVHVGVAITLVDPAEAARMLAELRALALPEEDA